jgi:hypothetical protein
VAREDDELEVLGDLREHVEGGLEPSRVGRAWPRGRIGIPPRSVGMSPPPLAARAGPRSQAASRARLVRFDSPRAVWSRYWAWRRAISASSWHLRACSSPARRVCTFWRASARRLRSSKPVASSSRRVRVHGVGPLVFQEFL